MLGIVFFVLQTFEPNTCWVDWIHHLKSSVFLYVRRHQFQAKLHSQLFIRVQKWDLEGFEMPLRPKSTLLNPSVMWNCHCILNVQSANQSTWFYYTDKPLRLSAVRQWLDSSQERVQTKSRISSPHPASAGELPAASCANLCSLFSIIQSHLRGKKSFI